MPAQVTPLLRRVGALAGQLQAPAYAVGGCVRDWWLGLRQTADLDVTVEGSGIDVARAAAAALGGSVSVHQQFGTATLVMPRQRIDFATCRREVYAKPAAYPTVSPGTLEDDLFRRDFTINAMAVALLPQRFGTLIDPFGGGDSLRRRELRILHDRSFLDDPSRILRGVRFAARFGLRWERRTAAALRAAIASGALGWLNAGRLRRELELMCEEPDPVACLRQLEGLLR
jgi:tRNA nucleotidyltransferase (CCA-adding enzyme)